MKSQLRSLKKITTVILFLVSPFWAGAPVLGEPISSAKQEVTGPALSPKQLKQVRQSDQQQLRFRQALVARMENQDFTGPEGALAPLAQYLESGSELAFISWKPVDFQKAVRAGFTTVWLGTGSFLQLSPSEQQTILAKAEQAKLRTLGFIGGDPDWVNPNLPDQPAKAVQEYQRLTQVLETFAQQSWGHLKFAFGVDVEPYVREWWDGDLSRYYSLLQKISIPVQDFQSKYLSRMEAKETFLTRFEPFWWKNGRVTDSGKVIHGLQDTSWSDVASMTYRDTSESLLNISAAIRARAQEMGKYGMRFLLGADTKPAGPGVPDYTTFNGQFAEMAGELIKAIRGMSSDDRKWMRGVFIHSSKDRADHVLDALLSAVPVGPGPSYPVLAVSPDGMYSFARRNAEGVILLRPSGQVQQVVRGILPLDVYPPKSVTFLSDNLLEIIFSVSRGASLPPGEITEYYFVDSKTLFNNRSMVQARISPDRSTLYYLIETQTDPVNGRFFPLPAFFLVSYSIGSGNRQYLQLPGSGESYSLVNFEVEAISPSGNYLLGRRAEDGLLVNLRNFTQEPRLLQGVPALSPEVALSVRFIDDQTLEGTYDYRIRSGNPNAPVDKKLYFLGPLAQPQRPKPVTVSLTRSTLYRSRP